MADEGKKVSFGFSKSIKKSTLKVAPQLEEKKVDYIECLDAKSIKVVGGEEKKDEVLVIPMLGSKTWHDRIINKTDADIFERKTKIEKKENGAVKITNGDSTKNADEPTDVFQIKKEAPDETEEVPKTLEEQAADEIIQDLKTDVVNIEDRNLALPMAGTDSLHGTQQSTLEDYEQIPIDVFGLAMLRGMGWKPGKGLGKDEKLCAASLPELRPRRMGLGADKALQKQNAQTRTKEEEDLKLNKGTFVKVVTGKHANNYGQIEGFDDGAGRLIVKMALSGETLSMDECVVQPVTKAEYAKNSKVLNAAKFEEYKNRKPANGRAETSDDETSDGRESKNRRTDRNSKNSSGKKKSKRHSRHSSDESSESTRGSRKRKDDSSESDRECRQKRSKKTKKSHKRDSSPERSSRKSKKKDKDRERTKDRKSEYSESLDRRKYKKHRRSRSRSPQRR